MEPGTAEQLINSFEKAILGLEELPNRGALRKKGLYANKGYRQLYVKNFTVVYRVDEVNKQVIIVAVRYSKSEF